MLLARVCLVKGDLAYGDVLATRVASDFSAMGYPISALEASLVRAEIALADGRTEDALAVVAEADGSNRDGGESLQPRVALVRSRALVSQERLDEADVAIAAGLASAREQNLPFEEALLLKVRSEVVSRLGGAGAITDAAEADRMLRAMGARSAPSHAVTAGT
jgi:hypothetical protein